MNRMLDLWKKGALACGTAAMLLLAAACGNSETSTSSAPAPAGGGAAKTTETSAAGSAAGKKKLVIGMVAKSESNDVFQAAKTGAFDAAKELGAKYGVDIKIDWRTPPDEDAAKQAEAVSALANEKADAILVSCSDARTLTGAINDAVDKGVVVACFDSDAPDSKRLFDYGTDDIECGQIIVAELAKFMGEKGTIAILAGNQSAPNLQLRVKGAREELAKHPNMHELNDGNGVFYHQETPEKAAEAVSAAMNANPGKIEGWAFIGGWPLFTDHALNWAPGTVKCVSCDALPKELEYLRDGHVQMLVAQDCYGWGYKGVQFLLENLIDGKKPASKIPNPLTKVTKENVDEFASYWDKWLKK